MHRVVLVRRCGRLTMVDLMRGRGRSNKYWVEVIRQDTSHLQFTEDTMTLDKRIWELGLGQKVSRQSNIIQLSLSLLLLIFHYLILHFFLLHVSFTSNIILFVVATTIFLYYFHYGFFLLYHLFIHALKCFTQVEIYPKQPLYLYRIWVKSSYRSLFSYLIYKIILTMILLLFAIF